MKGYKLLFVFCLSLVLNEVSAQVSYQQQYLNAKSLFESGKNQLAMEAFKPLMKKEEGNPFAAYASFYYAVAAYRDGYLPMAKNMFLQVKQTFPGWSKTNEVNFWLGKVYFELEEYNQGLNALKDIKDRGFEEDVRNLKYYAFGKIADVKQMKMLQENNPNDRVLGEMLAHAIAKQPLVNQDQQMLDRLIKKFNLDEKGLERVKVDKSEFKDSYKVAVLFPFLINKLDIDTRKKVNQLVLDIYLGMKLATDSLQAQGVKLEMYAYDTKRDSVSTSRLLEMDEMKGMDLIIGPFFPEPRNVVQEFSFKNKINMISPLSLDSDVIGTNPYSFLIHPTYETLGRCMADYVDKHARNKKSIIFYGDNKRDSTLAYAYKERIEQHGFEVVINKEIGKQNTREILDILVGSGRIKDAASDAARSAYKVSPNSVGHIFVASNNDLISSKVISAVDTRGDSIMVVGSADWLELPVINYEVYQRLGTVMYAPMYIQKETEAYERFRKSYVEKHRVPPTQYAAIGYDLMMLMGNSLNDHGKYFQLGWNKQKMMKGYLSMGYSFEHSQDNNLVPVIEFADEGLELKYEIEEIKNDDSKE